MATINDYNKRKALDVASKTGTPTISRTVPIKITSGNDGTTGTGEIVLDWTNIASKADIGVYDENDNLLDYYFESFDATAETAVIWVYRDWVRDGTTQAQIAYGNGPSDQSVAASTVFDKETDLQAGYLFNESSGDLLDVTSNNNDGTVNGATQGETGVVDGAYSFDGSNDYVDIDSSGSAISIGSSDFTIECWIKTDSSIDIDEVIFAKDGDAYFCVKNDHIDFRNSSHREGTVNIADQSWHHCITVVDRTADTITFYVDGAEDVSLNWGLGDFINDETTIGVRQSNFSLYLGAILDNLKIYNTTTSSEEATALYDATKSSPDFFSQQATAITFSVSDTLSLTDSETAIRSRLFSVTSSFSLSDTATALRGYFFSVTDSLGLTDSATSIRARIASVSDNLNLTESISNIRTRLFSVTSSFSLSDTVTAIKGAVFSVKDTLKLSETVTSLRGRVASVLDRLGLSEKLTFPGWWTKREKPSTSWTKRDKPDSTDWTKN